MKPNILMIVMDDLAWGDLSCHGNRSVSTPSLDRLHAASARLTRHCSGPLCTPARAELFTGRNHPRTGAIDTYLGRATLHPGERTLAHQLRDSGYATGLFGKWHLGDHHPCRPFDMGFDTAAWHPGGGIGQPADFPANTYYDPVIDVDGQPERTHGYCTDVFSAKAMEFIHSRNGRPWFCFLGTNAPHSPFEVPDAWTLPFRNAGLPDVWARVYAMVANIDQNVGRLLAQLDRLGIAEDTLVVYTSDHGPCRSASHEGDNRYNGGLRAAKGTLYEGGIRVPAFLRWPGKIRAGLDVGAPTSPIDFLPTLCAAAKAPLPADRVIDGVDLLDVLCGERDEKEAGLRERKLFFQWHRGNTPERYRNYAVVHDSWKLIRPGIQQGPVPPAQTPDELYDIAADPGEANDRAGSYPDKVEALRRAYDAWYDAVCRERGDDTFAPIPIPLDNPAEPHVRLTHQDWRIGDEQTEGWSCDNPGWWPVRVAGRCPLQIRVFAPPGLAAPYHLHMQCGDWSLQREIGCKAQVEVFDNLELPVGRHDLTAIFIRDEHRFGALRVEVLAAPNTEATAAQSQPVVEKKSCCK